MLERRAFFVNLVNDYVIQIPNHVFGGYKQTRRFFIQNIIHSFQQKTKLEYEIPVLVYFIMQNCVEEITCKKPCAPEY